MGNTGVRISRLCMGTMSFGGDADEKTSAAMFQHCRDAGINVFDCADVYANGRSEEILGKCIRDCRDDVIVTSKAYFATGEDVNARGSSRRHILHAVEASLRRLKTDTIDIYFLHRFDDFTDLEDTLRTLDDLVHAGKILYIGMSNFAAWQIEKSLGISAMMGIAACKCIQPMYSLVKRQAEVEILPMAQAENLGVLPYSPLGGGLLTGNYGIDKKPDSGRLAENKMYMTRYGSRRYYEIAEAFTDFAQKNGFHPVSLAIAWVAAHPAVTAPIIGARNIGQLQASLGATDIEMTPDLRDTVSGLSDEPAPATDRNEESTAFNYGAR